MTITRTFTREQLDALDLPGAWADNAPEILHREQVDTRRWVSVNALIFRAPDDGKTYRVYYEEGLTESQDDTDPWNDAKTVEAVEVEQYDRTAKAWRSVGERPTTAEPEQPTAEQAAAEFDAGTAVLAGEQVTAYAAAIEAATLRAAADRITALGKARGRSTWAADYIHPDREFVDTGEDVEEQPAAVEEPATPSVGDRYVKRAEPDEGRIVTINRVWTADDGHTAVAYEWDDPRASYSGSACPLDVFHRTYEAQQ